MNTDTSVPVHVALIPDGNRRWARKNKLPDVEGHRFASEKTLPAVIESLMKSGVKYFTFWAMSTENFNKRSREENDNLINLMRHFLRSQVSEFNKKNIRLKVIGDVSVFPVDLQELIKKAMVKTEDNDAMTVIFAINYGGRDEIVRAVKKCISDSDLASVSKETIEMHLDTCNVPDPDLIIRTGGEKRISGFMLWQSEYAEYEFSEKLFPEFTKEDCIATITNFSNRERRFGK